MAETDINVIYPTLGDGAGAVTFHDAGQDGWGEKIANRRLANLFSQVVTHGYQTA